VRAAAVLRPVVLAFWAAVSVAAAAWLALVEVFWLPLRVGTVLVPVSLVAAVLGNYLLVEGTHRASRSRVVAVLPAVTWIVVAVAAAFRRPEGDLVVLGGTGDLGLLGLAFLLLGVVAAAVAVGRALARPLRPLPEPVRPPEPARDRAGSGSGGAR
jgi:Family of unknown function (DUF6113)